MPRVGGTPSEGTAPQALEFFGMAESASSAGTRNGAIPKYFPAKVRLTTLAASKVTMPAFEKANRLLATRWNSNKHRLVRGIITSKTF